jgi:hypothetical protein
MQEVRGLIFIWVVPNKNYKHGVCALHRRQFQKDSVKIASMHSERIGILGLVASF